jgi:hypothetical protein
VKQRLAQLTHRFRQQQQFAEDYSPLYAALFGTVADWLTYLPQDPAIKWLLEATRNRAGFDITNLLASGLHYEVLRRSDEVSALAAYYPTVGGDASPQFLYAGNTRESRVVSQHFVQALHSAILARRRTLRIFVQTNTVQTNETGRGISWLLPSCLARWKGVHLVDLGSSAGLNLIAEQRVFQFLGPTGDSSLLKLGFSKPVQFVVRTEGESGKNLASDCLPPAILSRTGCDVHPFQLKSTADEQILASFIWADQMERLKRLREGIAAFHRVQRSAVPVRLFTLSLPDDLLAFLDRQQSGLQEPLVIYNTYIKIYLPDRGEKLRDLISEWAARQNRPVVWIQWEPPNYLSLQSDNVPKFGWLAWTADIWHKDKHHQFHLGWIHPHGQQVQWLPGLEAWRSYWSRTVNSSKENR